MAEDGTGRIWWVASYPKSGNTWARMMLDAYYMGVLDMNGLRTRLVKLDLWAPAMQATCPWPLPAATQTAVVLCRPAALCNLLVNHGHEDAFLKTHHANVRVQEVPLIPKVLTHGAIYVVRDPRDVVISWSHHSEPHMDFDQSIEMLNNPMGQVRDPEPWKFHFLRQWRQHVASWVGTKAFPVLTVRFEDMKADAEKELMRMLAFLGEETVSKKRLAFALENTTFDALHAMEEKDGFGEKRGGDHFFRCGLAEQWRAYLTPKQVRAIEEVHGEIMEELGYELDQVKGKNPKPELVTC